MKSVNVLRGYIEELPTSANEGSADFVVCSYVLCSVVDVDEALQSIHHLLKPVSDSNKH